MCVASRAEWHVSSSIKKEPLGQKPIFIEPISSCTVPHGEVARFHARVSGMPRPDIRWLHNDHLIQSLRRHVTTEMLHYGRIGGQDEEDLHSRMERIIGLQPQDEVSARESEGKSDQECFQS
uniref:Immunoglobulin I-set domain-containing protein n=1 Tax=Erpetoichthys calabaricus TaxID=27687 RepID=A0A8C4S6P2_ERPCA